MSLEELKRLCVKFILADDGHSRVVNVGDCEGGVEVIERVLKKMGKITSGPMHAHETDDGGLVVDGWAMFSETSGPDGSRKC
jgi:mitogen-activated protein kinase kinase kinase